MISSPDQTNLRKIGQYFGVGCLERTKANCIYNYILVRQKDERKLVALSRYELPALSLEDPCIHGAAEHNGTEARSNVPCDFWALSTPRKSRQKPRDELA
jgi:hypothetical protein